MAIAIGLPGCAAAPAPNRGPSSGSTHQPRPVPFDPSQFQGGAGLAMDTAVVVGTTAHGSGVASEFAWIRQHYPDAKPIGQVLTAPVNGRRYEVIVIRTREEAQLVLWFDVTALFSAGAH